MIDYKNVYILVHGVMVKIQKSGLVWFATCLLEILKLTP
jgi:hypothetical protein